VRPSALFTRVASLKGKGRTLPVSEEHGDHHHCNMAIDGDSNFILCCSGYDTVTDEEIWVFMGPRGCAD
jgi:hypothetical protein